jgi:hypothetical protein
LYREEILSVANSEVDGGETFIDEVVRHVLREMLSRCQPARRASPRVCIMSPWKGFCVLWYVLAVALRLR